jgi:hypothetical protein
MHGHFNHWTETTNNNDEWTSDSAGNSKFMHQHKNISKISKPSKQHKKSSALETDIHPTPQTGLLPMSIILPKPRTTPKQHKQQQHHHQHHPRWSQANTSYRSIIGNEHNLRNPVATPQQ